MVKVLVTHGSLEQVTRLANPPASPLLEFDDPIPAVLARFAPPAALPEKLIEMLAVFPKFSVSPSLVDVMDRAVSASDASDETLSLATMALARSTDPRAPAALGAIIDRMKSRPSALRSLVQPLVLSGAGRPKLLELAHAPSLSADDRTFFKLAAKLHDEARRSLSAGDEEIDEP